jgi:uncharacterized protein YkwD
VFALLGCAGSGVAQAPPSAAAVAEEVARSAQPRLIAPLSPRSGPAPTYVAPIAPGERPAPGDPLRDGVLGEVARAAASAGVAVPVHDVRLDKACDEIATSTRHREAPSFELVSFFLAHHGIVEPDPSLMFMRGTHGADDLALAEIRAQLPERLKSGEWGRVGVGVDRAGPELIVLLALQEQNLELQALPRRIPVSGRVALVGRLLGSLRMAQVFVTNPVGTVRELPVTRRDAAFDAAFSCTHGAGTYQVEIAGTNAQGPSVVANFPVYCGIEPPSESPALEAETEGPLDAAKAEQSVFALVNRDRAAAGLPALVWDGRLAAVARAHSEDMAQDNYVAHVSPRFGTVNDRIRRASLTPTLLSENVGRAYSAGQAQRGFMLSPGHRGNVIDKRVTHVGIGVAVGRSEGGQTPLFVTQLFAAGI